jgi:Skp family chaperone for outer membrane proteins
LRLVVLMALLSLFIPSTAFAQNGTAVLIDTAAFYDSATGIPELAAAQRQLEVEFGPANAEIGQLTRRIGQLQVDANAAAAANNEALFASVNQEIESLSRVAEIKFNSAQEAGAKRLEQLTSPIEAKILGAMKAYAIEKKIDVILDTSTNTIYVSESWPAAANRTADFIQWYRARPAG